MRYALVVLLALGCAKQPAPAAPAPVAPVAADEAAPEAAPAASAHLDAILAELWEQRLTDDPVGASYHGDDRGQDRWTPLTDEADARAVAREVAALQRIRDEVDLDALSDGERLTVRLFEDEVARLEAAQRWRYHEYPVNQMHGTNSWIPSFLVNIHRVEDVGDAEAYVARLEGVGELMDQLIARMEQGAERGVLPPAFVYPYALDDCRNIVSGAPFDDGDDSVLRADFREKVAALDLPDEEAVALVAAADRALVEVVAPAYARLVEVLEAQQAVATDDDGVWKLPDGDAYYAHRLRVMTTTDLGAAEIHQLGLDEVARIHAEMDAIREAVGFEGDLRAFFDHLRTDERFFHDDSEAGREAYLTAARAAIDGMRPRLPELFSTLPKAEVTVKAVEPYRERSAGKAFYQRGTPDGSRPGVYYVNLYDMSAMPTYQLEALAFHEGIPGHHMQLSIAQELEALPEVRKQGRYVAWSEGWGLYAEYVPKELGFYQDPYSDLGRLAMELWRAGRLVVDTGIHDGRWTRQQAIDWLVENTPNPEWDAVKAIERYIVMPGQATAYKIGMLKILELRGRAEAALGEDFDLRAFHDVILRNGPVPLDVLEELVDGWIAEQQG